MELATLDSQLQTKALKPQLFLSALRTFVKSCQNSTHLTVKKTSNRTVCYRQAGKFCQFGTKHPRQNDDRAVGGDATARWDFLLPNFWAMSAFGD